MPDGNFLIAWIDRRIDNPKPRQLYLMKIGADGKALTKNYQAGEGLCECCKLGFAFADDGKTVYMVDREVDGNKIRNHVLRKSTDGAATFGAPVEISNDGWQVPSCPHSGPSIGRDSRGWLHVDLVHPRAFRKGSGNLLQRVERRRQNLCAAPLVHANTAPEILYANLTVGRRRHDLSGVEQSGQDDKAQIFMRTIASRRSDVECRSSKSVTPKATPAGQF